MIEQIRKTNPEFMEDIPRDKAAALIRKVFTQMNHTLKMTEDGVVTFMGLGQFLVRKIEKELEGKKVTRTQIVFTRSEQLYELFGHKENRPGVDPVNRRLKSIEALWRNTTKQAPPAHLRKRVHGAEVLSGFENVGKTVAINIYSTIISASIELPENSRILDFGCGCGRVIRYFHNLYNKSEFHGTDIDREAILWCQGHLPHIGKFVVNEEWPPLPFADGFFDFVYSVSIFTHLPEKMQFKWLEELQRVTKKDGYLLLTIHGAELLRADSKRQKQLMSSGFYYSVGVGTEGLPDFYQTAFHTENYIASHWSNYFEIKQIVKKGINGAQDIVLCRKK